MSNTPEEPRDERKPLPGPIGEDGIIRKDDGPHPEDEIDDKDGGLTDVGGGDPNKRKIA